jgi:plastocyanin
MKTNFDKINPKKVLGYLMASAMVFFTGSVTAQTNHDVLIDSQTNTFTPASLTIDVGDQVTFTNDGGYHNVNGDLSTYPNNADGSMYSGAASNSLTTYVWVCTTAGNYDYQCDPHVGLGMVGTIAANAPPTACALDAVTLTLLDSYGDGGQTMTVDGVDYSMTSGPSDAFDLCIDLSVCTDLIYTNTDGYPSENSWTLTLDSDGSLLASGVASGQVGNCGAAPVLGCMDVNATNYDAAADTDDGSCVYPCLDNAVTSDATDSWPSENSFDITDCEIKLRLSERPAKTSSTYQLYL